MPPVAPAANHIKGDKMRHRRNHAIEWIVGAIVAVVLGFLAVNAGDDDDFDDDDCGYSCQVDDDDFEDFDD